MLKKLIALVLSLLVISAIPLSVSAGRGGCHGGSRSRVSTASRYRVCDFDDCEDYSNHKHNSNNYYGHYYGDGHDYHQECGVSRCGEGSLHYHDDVAYMPRSGNYSTHHR